MLACATALAMLAGAVTAFAGLMFATEGRTGFLSTVTMLMSSTPSFVLGLASIYIFAVWLDILPSGGIQTLGEEPSVSDFLQHLILPAMVLGLGSAAPLLRYTRAAMLEVLNSDYVTTARAKGLRRGIVVLRHAFRNSLIPIITVIGLLLPELVAGAVITEQIFVIPGFGRLIVDSIFSRDLITLKGAVLVAACLVVAVNLVVDILYAWLDPRIKVTGGSRA